MYLFNRTVTLRGNPRDVMPFVQEITQLANERSPFDISLWQALLGAPVGSFGWSALVDSRAVLMAGMAELDRDEDFLDLLERGEDFIVTPPEDSLVTILHTSSGELRRAPIGAAATITAATMEVDHTSAALQWSVGMCDLASSITGVPASLGAVQHGQFGELRWIATVEDISEVDRMEESLAKDPDYIERLGAAAGLFVPASGRQLLAMRLA